MLSIHSFKKSKLFHVGINMENKFDSLLVILLTLEITLISVAGNIVNYKGCRLYSADHRNYFLEPQDLYASTYKAILQHL